MAQAAECANEAHSCQGSARGDTSDIYVQLRLQFTLHYIHFCLFMLVG